VKRLDETTVSYEDLKKELVAYSLVEDFEQYRMKMDLVEQEKQDTIGKLRFEFFYKFVEAEKFEQRIKQAEQSIREDMVS
jgi:predicted transcriptional regulator